MNKLDALWEYQQAELALARLKREMKSSPSYQKRTKLHNFLAEQQASIEKINADMRAKDGSLATCSSKLDALLKRYDLEKSELDIMENDEESTAAELRIKLPRPFLPHTPRRDAQKRTMMPFVPFAMRKRMHSNPGLTPQKP